MNSLFWYHFTLDSFNPSWRLVSQIGNLFKAKESIEQRYRFQHANSPMECAWSISGA